MILITIAFILGIIMGLYLKSIILFLCLTFLTFIALYFTRIENKKKIILILIVLILSFFYVIFKENKRNLILLNFSSFENKECVSTIGIIDSEIIEKDNKHFFILRIEKIENIDVSKDDIKLKIRCKEINNDAFAGDKIWLSGKYQDFTSYSNFGVFDYKKHMSMKNMYGSFECYSLKILKKKKNIFLYSRYKIIEFIKNKVSDELKDNNGILIGILIGDKSELSDETKEIFRKSNISHVLAVSGMHVSYIILLISFILNKICKNKTITYILIILFLLAFLFIVGFTPSIFRAEFMAILAMINQIHKKKKNNINNLFLSLLILIIINPYYLFDLGCRLSYLTTLGILMFSNIDKFIDKNQVSFRNKITSYIKESIVVGISANIMIFPIICLSMNTFSISFLISGFLISPIISLVEMIGIIFILVPRIRINILPEILNLLINTLVSISTFISNIKFLSFNVLSPNIFHIIIYYLLIIHIYCFINNIAYKKKLKNIKVNAIQKLKKKISTLITICLIISVLFTFFRVDIRNRRGLDIYFLDVMQGDSTLVITKENKKILIDGGGNEKYDVGKNVLKPILYNMRIRKLDYIIISHLDFDHCGGIIGALEYIDSKYIILPIQFSMYKNYEYLVSKIKEYKKNTKIIFLEAGDKIIIDKYTYIDVLWPSPKNIVQENEINNNALVFKLYYRDISILFTGDIEEEAEKEITKLYPEDTLKSDILKVAHHGSDSSSIDEIIDMISPKIALIGVGKNNKYNHPSKVVIERLNSKGAKIYRTDLNGEIILKIRNNNSINIKEYKESNY